jgi:hypothetical protein
MDTKIVDAGIAARKEVSDQRSRQMEINAAETLARNGMRSKLPEQEFSYYAGQAQAGREHESRDRQLRSVQATAELHVDQVSGARWAHGWDRDAVRRQDGQDASDTAEYTAQLLEAQRRAGSNAFQMHHQHQREVRADNQAGSKLVADATSKDLDRAHELIIQTNELQSTYHENSSREKNDIFTRCRTYGKAV